MRRGMMAKEQRVGRVKGMVMRFAILLGTMGCYAILRTGLRARQGGLDPAAALREAISGGLFSMGMVLVVVALVMSLVGAILMLRGVAGKDTSREGARAAGSRLLRRHRLLLTVGGVLAIPLFVGPTAVAVLTGKELPDRALLELGNAVLFIAVAIVSWIVKPTPDDLYAFGTGDRSRIDDERARDVKGRSAVDAIRLFVALVLLVGVPYEVLIRGVWPLYSGLAAGAIFLLWRLCSWHWNRKL
jgi:hypothetical protein